MATAINTIKGWFTTGKFPTQAQFWAWIDAFRHKDDKVPVADIEGLNEMLAPVNEHFNDPNAHSELFANFAEINTILEDKGFVKTSESFTPNSGTRWNLKGQVFTNEVSIEMPISLCSTGFIRIDRVVLDMNNQFVYVIGDEFTENPVPKALPANTLDYTLIPVNDTEVGDPSSPVIGNIYQQKQFDALQTYIGTGTDVVIPLNTDGRSHIQLKGTMTSIAGLSFADLVANPTNAEYPHYGKRFLFFNDSGHDIVLKHLVGTEDIFFTFKEETDLVFPNGEFLEFFNGSNVFVNVFRSWKDISNKLDKVSTVDVEKVYIKNADGTQGMKPTSELGGGEKFIYTSYAYLSLSVVNQWATNFRPSNYNFLVAIISNAVLGTGSVPVMTVSNTINLFDSATKIKKIQLAYLLNSGTANLQFYIIVQDSNDANTQVIVNEVLPANSTVGTKIVNLTINPHTNLNANSKIKFFARSVSGACEIYDITVKYTYE